MHTAEIVGQLMPPGATMVVLDIAEATRQVAEGELVMLVVALDGDDWHADLQTLMDLHAVGEKRPLAVFALVPGNDPMALVKAFELNCADVATLPVNPHEVRARLAALVRRRTVAMARAAETRAVWRMAMIDPVTGLHNRHHLDSILPAAVDSARTTRRPLALLMIDLDALKPFNDRWGHAAGDRLLRAVADALKGSVRLCDTVARYGGDEIAIVMPDCDLATARGMAARLVRSVASMVPPAGRDSVTISIGIAGLEDRDVDAQALVMRADAALYDAKRGGRNRVAEAA